jgi:hypothetical protein
MRLLLLFFCWACQPVYAQLFPAKNYPQGYFCWPVKAAPGLAANFGELRPNHYHMGLDCKTEQRENVPIVAAADGYIAKVKIEPFGFGRCLYINHPNGLTTLYAHLNDFEPALEKYVTALQYRQESWNLFTELEADKFPVKKGQFIGYSGNTGGSQGPHLHFEVRDTKTDKVLNPLLFGFPIPDQVPPVVQRLALYDRNRSTYEQSPRFFPVSKNSGSYSPAPNLIQINTDKVSFGITAFDCYSGSTNQNGIFEALLYDNDQLITGFQLDSISYDETRYLNGHIDYKLRIGGGPFVQHLSRLPGFPQGTYRDAAGDGVIDLSDGSMHSIRILVKDTRGNASTVRFSIKSTGRQPYLAQQAPLFEPGQMNVAENESVSLYLAETQLYDSVHFRIKPATAEHEGKAFLLGTGDIPVHSFYPVKIRNSTTKHPDRMVMKRWWNNKDDYAKAEQQGDWYRSSFKALGYVELYADTIPPAIVSTNLSDGMDASRMGSIFLVVKDETDEFRNFRATLDGKWLRFTNDKGRKFVYKFDEHCPPGAHELKLHVEDCAGNATERTYHFTR